MRDSWWMKVVTQENESLDIFVFPSNGEMDFNVLNSGLSEVLIQNQFYRLLSIRLVLNTCYEI